MPRIEDHGRLSADGRFNAKSAYYFLACRRDEKAPSRQWRCGCGRVLSSQKNANVYLVMLSWESSNRKSSIAQRVEYLTLLCHLWTPAGICQFNHILRNCKWARAVWERIGIPLSKKASFNLLFTEWLRGNCETCEINQGNTPWNILLPMTVWMIWKQRNEAIFEDVPSRVGLAVSCLATACEVNETLERQTPWTKTQLQVRWYPPAIADWVKLNMDASVYMRMGSAGAGGVLKRENGNWIEVSGPNLGRDNGLLVNCGLWGTDEIFLHMSPARHIICVLYQ